MSNYNKGARGERELLSILGDEGFVGLRAPSSGSTTQRELPDILVGRKGFVLAIEAKREGGEYKYLDSDEVEDLYYFAEQFGAEAYIAVRFDRDDWYFFKKEEMYRTDSGKYRVKKETVDEGKRVQEII